MVIHHLRLFLLNQEYSTYLESPEWKQRRKQRLQLAQARCRVCGSRKRLQVHHLTYARIFNEPMEDLLVLCRQHHEAAESLIAAGAIPRRGEIKRLRRDTLRALRPTKSERTPADAFKEALLQNPAFLMLLRTSADRGAFKRAVRKWKKGAADLNRTMINGLVIWRDRKHLQLR